MSLTPTQLQELQTITLDLGEEFPHNADALWNAAIRIQKAGLGPVTGAGQAAFDAAVADIKQCQDDVQPYQQRQGSPNSGFDVAVLQVLPSGATFPAGNVGDILYLETAPNTYVAVDQIVIDPVGPNSVQMDEVGTTVFRTVPPASGGIEINNLSTGAGFERVLTTADLGGGAVPGGVDTNIQYNDSGAFGGSANFAWLEATRELRIGSSTSGQVAIRIVPTQPNNYTALRMEDQTGANFFEWVHDFGLSTANHELNLVSSQFGNIIEIENEGNLWIGGGENTCGLGVIMSVANGQVRVGQGTGATLYLNGTAAEQADFGNHGQLWVDSADDTLHYKGDGIADIQIGAAGGSPGGANTQIQYNDSGAFGGDANMVWDDVAKTLLISKLGGSGPALQVTNVLANTPIIQTGQSGSSVSNIPMRMYDNSGTQFFQWFFDTSLSVGNHKLELQSSSGGTVPFIEFDNSGEMALLGTQSSNALLFTGLTGTKKMKANVPLYFEKLAAAGADDVNEGQFWVRDTLDNEPMFTDGLGVDYVLNAAAAGAITFVIRADINTATPPTTEIPVCEIEFRDLDGTDLLGTVGFGGNNDMVISNEMHGGELFFRTQDAGGVVRTPFEAAASTIVRSTGNLQLVVNNTEEALLAIANGLVSISHNNIAMARTVIAASGGLQVNNTVTGAGFERVLTTGDLGLTPPIVLLDDEQIQFGTGTDVTMDWNGTEFDIEFAASASIMRLRDGAQLRFMSPNDVDSTFIQQLADRTNILSSGPGAGFWQFQPELRIINDLTFGTAGVILITESGGDMRIDLGTLGDLRIRGGNTGVEIMAEFTANAGVALYHDNARRFETVGIQQDGVLSGAILDDADGNMLHIGFQEQIWILEDGNLGTTNEVWRDAAGHILYSSDAGTETYTIPAAADGMCPDGYWVDIINLGTGAITVAEGVGVTLTHLDGGGATGSLVIAQFGKMRLHRRIGAAWYASNTVDVT